MENLNVREVRGTFIELKEESSKKVERPAYTQNNHYIGRLNLRTITKIAVPTLALLAISSLPRAEGGPGAFMACVALCDAAFAASTGGWGPVLAHTWCVILCGPFAAAPTP